MRCIIDRSEGEYWVLEGPGRRMFSVKKENLPPDCREGDVLDRTGDVYQRNLEETARRRKRLAEKLEKLRNSGKGD